MKVGELRKQGWTAIQGDVVRCTFLMRLSEVAAIAINKGINDHCEVIELAWRSLEMPYENINMPLEFEAGGYWRPYLSLTFREYKPAVAIDEKPVFTQVMADNGELPPVGCKCLVKHKYADATWAQPDFNEKIITAYGKELMIFTSLTSSDNKESVGAISDYLFRPLDTRTEKQKAVDAAIAEWPVADKATLELAYDLWAPKIEQ